jgi:hypothetical protein
MVFEMLLCDECHENVYIKCVQTTHLQRIKRRIFCTPLNVIVYVILATQ